MTPYEQKFKVPGRFEEHECTFITWLCQNSDLEILNYEYEIVINPKMSFGTGHHETTQLMIQRMLNINL